MSATLPRHLIEPTLADLAIGDSAWIVPWALIVHPDLTLSIAADMSGASSRPGGTVQMQITRVEGGVEVLDMSDRLYRIGPPLRLDGPPQQTLPVVAYARVPRVR